MRSFKPLIKNGKYFVLPEADGRDFKALFQRLASAGAGRPVDKRGFPEGPWTPDLLAKAISQIDANQSGIELRTVQLWFQDNDTGISSDSIRWLARIFGCDDPEATSAWQAELSASQSRLAARRRQERQATGKSSQNPPDADLSTARDDTTTPPLKAPQLQASEEAERPFSLPRKSEAFLARASPLDLPASVFAGAVALGFCSYFLGIHSVTFDRDDGVTKQVGFLWAPNWTLLFMVFMPLFFAFAGDLLDFWKTEGRATVLAASGGAESDVGWAHRVEGSAYTYWAVFLICLGFAGLFQWISVRLIPLLQGGGQYAIDWGSLAIGHPEALSVHQAVAFTGFAYLYMCLCFYLFFVGLILLYTLVHDLWEIEHRSAYEDRRPQPDILEIRHRIMRGIFRCTICGVLIAACMKLQSLYLITNAESVLDWLFRDTLSVLSRQDAADKRTQHSTPTQYTSLLIAFSANVVFLYGFIRIGLGTGFNAPLGKMVAVVALSGTAYLLIGAFAGFSILLGVSVLVSIFGLFDPAFGTQQPSKLKGGQNVL
ncbi:RcgA family putative transporter [Tabrizicola sp.]|uniref:RcgA family putative transporter n=1 Tax=Tabrizicola sp. TaxID=2005166 RepID=UPI003F33A5B8